MPKQYRALKRKYGQQRAAKIYVGKGKTAMARKQRAKRLKNG